MFLGEFEHTIDDKGRITIPAKFRGRLAAGMVVTKGIDDCLWLYPEDVWTELAQRTSALPVTDSKAREFSRQLLGGACDTTPDRQGRINLPSYLREYAKIDRQAVIVGLYNHCEIWNADHWRERQERSHNDPEGRAAYFESLGI
jgi:MraZ protein